MKGDRYSEDVLAGQRTRGGRLRAQDVVEVEARRGVVVEVAGTGFTGAVVQFSVAGVLLEDGRGRRRTFRLSPAGFRHEGRPATLIAPVIEAPREEPRISRSGSLVVEHEARVARASRIWVEGVHDAELIEHVWGEDLRWVGVVIEPIGGIDDLAADVRSFQPSPERRLGVLVDHFVAGSKEHRIAGTVRHPDVLVLGHPHVDIWAAVNPKLAGLDAWPRIPMGQDWKTGICEAAGAQDSTTFWRTMRNKVSGLSDLDRQLVQSVERLIDFVTVDGGDDEAAAQG